MDEDDITYGEDIEPWPLVPETPETGHHDHL